MWQKVLSKLDHLGPTDRMGRGEKRKRKGGKKLRERTSTFSLGFFGDRTGKFWRSKKKSASPHRELQVETRNGEFRQTPRGRSSPTLVILYLKGCVVVSCPKGNVWLHFEPWEAALF